MHKPEAAVLCATPMAWPTSAGQPQALHRWHGHAAVTATAPLGIGCDRAGADVHDVGARMVGAHQGTVIHTRE